MSKTVLIVEDNHLDARLFQDLLFVAGYDSVVANDGMEAIAAARQGRPDLILLDLQLPRMSGLEIVRFLRQDRALRTVPVVATSAFDHRDSWRSLLEAGFDDFVEKPVMFDSFRSKIEYFLEQPARRAGAVATLVAI
ncbi:MAG: response regulator [Minwuiales bacterium]|nr:response regulator [Minwuiales bacterium]